MIGKQSASKKKRYRSSRARCENRFSGYLILISWSIQRKKAILSVIETLFHNCRLSLDKSCRKSST